MAGTMKSSLNGLNELTVPPDYLQMHKGTYDQNAFDDFVGTHDYIADSLIVEMLNINNANIIYQGETLEKSLMDNGFIRAWDSGRGQSENVSLYHRWRNCSLHGILLRL